MTDIKTVHGKLVEIQKKLEVPKGQLNSFGGYKYRSCEDILEAVKPLLDGLTLILEDELVQVGDRYYVKATAYLSDGAGMMNASAYAREPEDKKGMDASQITGATSSYARKYALNGLFAIDDVKDADSMDNTKDLIPTHTTTRTPEGTISTPKQEESNAPVRPEAPYCTEHKQYYYKQEKNGKVWYSHRNVDDTWCNMK